MHSELNLVATCGEISRRRSSETRSLPDGGTGGLRGVRLGAYGLLISGDKILRTPFVTLPTSF